MILTILFAKFKVAFSQAPAGLPLEHFYLWLTITCQSLTALASDVNPAFTR